MITIKPEHEIRWQAALAVLEDLEEDQACPLDMNRWGSSRTKWDGNECGTAACFAGYIAVSPYCRELGAPSTPTRVVDWLYGATRLDALLPFSPDHLFSPNNDMGSRKATLRHLKKEIKAAFKLRTGKTLRAPLTFYVD
jgi:hypothetical protein